MAPKPKKAETKKPSTSYSPRAYVTGLRKEMYAVQGAESKKKSDARIAAKKASTSYSPKLMGIYEQYDMARTAKKKMDAKAEAKKLKATKYAPAPMTAKQKETTRRAAEKKQALRNLKKDPIVKGTKAALKTAGNPVGAGIKAASTAANMAAKGAKAVIKATKKK
jgi:hypothetical protein